MKQTKTTQLTLGAVLLAVFLLLHIIIPGGQKSVQGMLLVITFLPVTIYCMNFGVKKTLIMIAAGALLSGLLLPLEVFLSFALPALLIGLVAGVTYGKWKRLAVILLLSALFLLQNIGEIAIYFWLANIDVRDTFVTASELFWDVIPESFLEHGMLKHFLEDFLLCAIPCLAVMVSGAKGILSFMIIRILKERLETLMGPDADPAFTEPTKFTGKGISIAYFCAICICAMMAALPFLGVIPYHFVSAAFAAAGLLIAVLYAYYFYINRIRTIEDRQKLMICSFLTLITLPIGIFALPWVEMHLLKQEQEE